MYTYITFLFYALLIVQMNFFEQKQNKIKQNKTTNKQTSTNKKQQQ